MFSNYCSDILLLIESVLQAVVDIMKTLPVSQYASLMEWINKCSKNDMVPGIGIFSNNYYSPEAK